MPRVRQVIGRSPYRVVYKFPSIKLKRTVYCESGLELDYAFLLDADHDVNSFQEQPGKIKYYLNGKLRTYTPDFFVPRPNKKQIVEVKPESKVATEESKILFGIIDAICREAGCEFVVVTDAKIRVQPRLDNIKLFWKYGRTPIYPRHQIYCHEFFARKHNPVLGELFEFFAYQKEGKAVVFSLLYWGFVGIDINAPVNFNAPVYLPV
jgi:TnsA endonuclease N terminal